MNISKISVKRPIATLMAILAVLSFGFLSLTQLSMDLFPNMNIPIVLVMTTYDGAGPQEIESLITKPLEERLSSVSGLDYIESTSSSGSSMVMVRFTTDVDVDNAAADVREQVDLIKSMLPEDANDPVTIKIDINSMSGIMMSVTGNGKNVTELKTLLEDDIVPIIERQPGVGSVSVMGGTDREIQVVVDENKLRGYGITEATLSSMITGENINTPLGSIYRGNKNLTLRIKGEYTDITEIENIPLTTASGGTIHVRDVAQVIDGLADTTSVAYTDDMESINLRITKQSTANTVGMSDAVMKKMEDIKRDYPDLDFLVLYDPADYIRDALSNVVNTALQGGVLAIIILFVFLRSFRSTMVVGIAMPVSIIATFAAMKVAGVNFNLMSLGGLALGIGMLVDNSIVVLESIFQKLEQGIDRFTAAVEGGREVTNSVIASTLTTVVVFLPITFVGGSVGELFNDMCLTIVFSLSCSLVVALTFVPMACSILLSPENIKEKDKSEMNVVEKVISVPLNAIGHFLDGLTTVYKKVLHRALLNKKITVLIAFAFVVLTGCVIPTVGMDFMPASDEGSIAIEIECPKGTEVDVTEGIAWQVIDAVRDIPEIEHIALSTGGSGGMAALMGSSDDAASITIDLVDLEERDRSSDQVAQEMRELTKNIAGARIECAASSNSMGSYSGGDLEIHINGVDDNELKRLSDEFVNRIKDIPGLVDVKSSYEEGSPQTTIRINRDKAYSYGITTASIASMLRTDITGSTPTTYKINDDEYDIRIMQADEKINYISDVENLLIPTAQGGSIPFSEIAEIINESVPTSITRKDQTTYVSVTANLENISTGDAQTAIAEAVADMQFPDDYNWIYGGSAEQMAKSFSGLLYALIIAIFLVYMVMAAEFEAFSFPAIVMFSIPIAVTGGLFGCFVTGESISVTSLLGLIMLAGVVINNAIVLIDYTNLLIREHDQTPFDALEIAGPTRLRPILMSSLTTVLGMVPMMLSQASGAETMRGLAIVVVFGLSLSTLVTLLLVPAVYLGFNNVIARGKIKKEKRKARKIAKKAAKSNG